MSKYKTWTIDDIKIEISKLEKKSNFYLDSDVVILINPRLRRSLGRCLYKRGDDNLTKIDKIEFSKYLVDGTVCEEEVKDTIIHEFCHAYTDYNKPDTETRYGDGHGKEWKQNAIKLGCRPSAYYDGDEFTYRKPENKTLRIRCKNCGKIIDTCDMVLGHEVEQYYICYNKKRGQYCMGSFEAVEDISTDEKRLRCIKKYIKEELTGNTHGETKGEGIYKYKLSNIKGSSILNLRISYKDNIFSIQVTNKIWKIANEEDKTNYKILIQDVEKYLSNKELFKFINDLQVEFEGEDKYIFSFPLDIENTWLDLI